MATLLLVGCDQSATAPRLDQLTLDVVSGDGQTAVVGTQLAPLIVKVTSTGNPVPLQVLNFRVLSGGGSVYGGTELTDAHGIAQELWTLGTRASEVQKVEVRAVEASTGAEKVFATFSATALPAAAETLFAVAGNSQTAAVGSAVTILPAVEITDQYRNPISGASVAFAAGPASGSATGLSQTTNASGIATVGSWTLSGTAESNTLTATSGTLNGSPVTFTATATGPPGLNITNYRGDGQTQSAGASVLVAPAAQVTGLSGHPVAGVQVVFSVTAGGGSVTGATQVTDANGITTVGSWTLGATPGVNELKAAFNTGVSRGSTIFVATGTAGNFWTTRAPMPTARDGAAVGVISGLIYVATGAAPGTFGTTANEAYDPVHDTWVSHAPAPTRRANVGSGVIGGKLYVVGGCINSDCASTTNRLEIYDPVADVWTTGAPMPTARFNMAAAVIAGELYVAGGEACCYAPLSTLEVYDPSTDTWVSKAPLPTTNAGASAAVVNGILYVIGGSNTSGNLATVEAYDPFTDTWTAKAPLPIASAGPAAGVVNGIIYVAGGVTGASNAVSNTVQAYNPTADSWTMQAPMPTARNSPVGAVVSGRFYAIGGVNAPNVALTTNEAYQP